MPSMCVSRLTSWCCRTTRPSAARTGAISFWMRLRTSRTLSHSAGNHCSTSTGGDGDDGDLLGWLPWPKGWDAQMLGTLLTILPLISSHFLQPETPAPDGNPLAEQPYGTVVLDALFDAPCLPVSSRIQRMVL